MPPQPRQLMVHINHHVVGCLSEVGNVWAFQYDPAWLAYKDAFPLCPTLPLQTERHLDGASLRPVQWYFDNLLPEETPRLLLAEDAKVPVADAFGLLEYYGEESAGSLTLLPPGVPVPEGGEPQLLDDASLTRRIENLPRVPLSHGSPKRMSLAGAQHKLPVVYKDDVLYEPAGASMSTHILKPNHDDVNRYSHSVINEWFVMSLAGRLKRTQMTVPAVYRHYSPLPVYLVERFDRRVRGGIWEREHIIDGCQVENLAATYKYTHANLERFASYVEHSRKKGVTQLKLFEWLVFNVLVSNTDAHLKNVSFFTRPDELELTPAYDLLCLAVYATPGYLEKAGPTDWKSCTMAWPLADGVVRLEQMNRQVLLDAAEKLGLTATVARVLLDNLVGQIFEAAKELYEEMQEKNKRLREQRPELAAILNGEERLVRTIVHVVIREMAEQLA